MDLETPQKSDKDDSKEIDEGMTNHHGTEDISNEASNTEESIDLNKRISEEENRESSISDENKDNDEEQQALNNNTADDKESLSSEDAPGKTEKRVKPLSNRIEYLSRPKKDFLDNFVDERPDGSVPENSFPSWNCLSLETKIPLALCPIPVTRKKLGTDLFLPPPANDFYLSDENNLHLPCETYCNLHDPYLDEYVRKNPVHDHLIKEGYVTESERPVCTLKDIHKYRRYQRRILAAEAQKKLRDEDEEFRKKRAEGMEQKIKRDTEKYQEQRKQGSMRRWIKNTVASIQDSSMKNQKVRDMKVLNSQISRQKAQKERVEASKERYDRLFAKHMKNKYDDAEKMKKDAHLALAEKDVERIDKLCKRQEEERRQQKEKLEEFYKRKFACQKEWMEQGLELERLRQEEREKNIDILKRTGRLSTMYSSQEISNGVKSENQMKDEANKDEYVPDEDEDVHENGHSEDVPDEKDVHDEDVPENGHSETGLKSDGEPEVEKQNATADISRESLPKSSEPETKDINEKPEVKGEGLNTSEERIKSSEEDTENALNTEE